MSNNPKPSPPVPIEKHHQTGDFDCGTQELNQYLQNYALQNHKAGGARTYAATLGEKVIGYYSLAFGSVSVEQVPPRVKKGMGRYPVPVMVLARLAVDHRYGGMGIGGGLLKDALARAVQASEIGGLRAVLVHAKDEKAKAFYHRFDFIPSPVDEWHLYLLIKDIKAMLKQLGQEI